jgi:hypothetical protein
MAKKTKKEDLQPRMLSDRDLNMLRGKAMVGHASVEEILQVFGHIDALHDALDTRCDYEVALGTEGWRRFLGHPDSD